MVIYRSAKNLLTGTHRKARSFLTVTVAAAAGSTTTSSVISPPSPSFPLGHNRSPLSPISRWIGPLHGPLFLSSPPWKLSQSATPLWENRVVLRRVKALNLELIRARSKFPGFRSVLSDPAVSRRVDKEGGPLVKVGFLDSIVNVPNSISISRLVSGPFLGWMIVNEMYSYAFVGLALSGLTDWLDGYMARKMRIDSVVGSYLDPLADKVLIGCVALTMVHNDLLHPGLVGIVVLRDVVLVGGAVYLRARNLGWQWKSWSDFFNLDGAGRQKVEPLFISKMNTVLQLVLVAAALLQPEFGTQDTQPFITYLSWVVAATTAASTAAYGAQYMRKRPALGAT